MNPIAWWFVNRGQPRMHNLATALNDRAKIGAKMKPEIFCRDGWELTFHHDKDTES